MNTFSTYTTATLHVPSTSYYNYWYDTQWSQFRSLEEFIAVYEYFYINNDFTISDAQGTISGDVFDDDPDADLNPGSGLIVETDENNPQMLDEMHIKAKGSDVASVITASNMEANKVYFDIEINAGRWYFLSFPFNVKAANVTAPGQYVFRTYDPANPGEPDSDNEQESIDNGRPGDVNNDGKVNVTDIMAVANHILNITMTVFNARAADVNNDGKVNVTDIMGIANIILGVNTTGSSRATSEADAVEPQ